MRARRWLAALVAAVSVGLSACASMPSSGEPQAFDLEMPNTEPVEQTGFGPQRNAPPEQILSDFLRASAAGSTDDYATAKKYLAEDLTAVWKPRASVIVYPTDQAVSLYVDQVSDRVATVLLETEILATVNEAGVFSPQEGTRLELTFDLSRGRDNQWRITRMDDGVILSQANFQASYQAMQLYFLAPGQESLVPDPRWYPRRRMASYLVSGLLAGPSEQLQPAVSSALGDSLRLPTQGVEVDGQVARVFMEGEAPAGSDSAQNMSRQLSATLFQMTTVTGVDAEINSVPLPESTDPFGVALELETQVGLRQGSIVVSQGDSWDPLLAGGQVGENPAAPALSPLGHGALAWLNGPDEVRVWSGGETRAAAVPSALDPSLDRWGWTWTATLGADHLVALDPQGNQVSLPLPADAKAGIQKVEISADGVHVLLLLKSEEGIQPFTAAIVRDAKGAPQSVVNPVQVEMVEPGVIDGSWAGATNLVFLSGGEGERTVSIVALGGFAQKLVAPGDAERISAGGQATRILLESEDGHYYSRSGGVWRTLDMAVEQVSYAG